MVGFGGVSPLGLGIFETLENPIYLTSWEVFYGAFLQSLLNIAKEVQFQRFGVRNKV